MSDAYIRERGTTGLILDGSVAIENYHCETIDIRMVFNHIYNQETLILKYGDTTLIVPFEDIREIITNE